MSKRAEVAAHLDLSGTKVSELAARGIIPRSSGRGGFDLEACRLGYIRHLRETAAGRAGQDEGPDLVDERARLARAQADRAEMENAHRRGELIETGHMNALVTGCFAIVRAKLLGIPSKEAGAILRCEDSVEVEQRIRAAICEALKELSETDVSRLDADGDVVEGANATA